MDACNSNANYINTNYADNCGSRLPCGLCLITNQPCPMYPIGFGGPTCSTTISNLPILWQGSL